MRLDFVPLDKLSVSKANMRYAKKAPDVSDILPTVRKRGVLQPVLVRSTCPPANDTDGGFEIVAGFRRYTAATLIADERRAAGEEVEPMPCAILDAGDDADAIEASMIENMARLDASEVQQWVTFTRLVKEGRSVEDIAATFGLPDLTVKRVLALGNLLPRIRALYAADEIDRDTVRHLTLATKRQQLDWLTLWDDPEARAPRYGNLKAWLLGGDAIRCSVALFAIEGSGLGVVADLFGDGAVFADASAFWAKQDEAVEAKRAALLAEGWGEVVIVPPGDHFNTWQYEKRAKRKGGRVYIDVRSSGEVAIHEGYVSRREAAKVAPGSESDPSAAKPARPEVTAGLQTYIDLHRHAAVRAHLTSQPGVALRLLVAHAIIGSPLVRFQPEPQSARAENVRHSVCDSPGEALFDERRRAVLALIGASPEDPNVCGGNGDAFGLSVLFFRLLALPDPALMDVVAVVMGEALQSGHAAVDCAALTLGTDMADWWEADETFFGLVRDKAVLGAMMAEVAGATVAAANAKEKGATMKQIIADHLAGAGGRAKVERWVPGWLGLPPTGYTERGGVGSVRAHGLARAAREEAERIETGAVAPNPDAAPGAVADSDDVTLDGETAAEGARGTGDAQAVEGEDALDAETPADEQKFAA